MLDGVAVSGSEMTEAKLKFIGKVIKWRLDIRRRYETIAAATVVR